MEDSNTSRIMSHLTDSLIAQLTQLHPSLSINPHHASLIQRRVQNLLPTLHTPTHPPYAFMIRNAIIGLKEEDGSTEEAISGFIRREYNDLPWAHAKLLAMQLEKLCQIGDIARAVGERFVLGNDEEDHETKEQCENSEKRKRVNRRRNVGDGDSVEGEESQKGQPQVVGQQCQDSMLHLETTCSSQPTAMKCLPAAGSGLSPAQLQMQVPCPGNPKRNLDENPMSTDSEEKPLKRPRGRPPKLDTGSNHLGESLLPSDDDIHNEQRQHQNGRGRGRLSRGLGRGRGRCLGRPPKINQIIEQCEEQLQRGDQDKHHGRRGRGRPPKLNGNLIQYKESQQEDQTRKHSRCRGRGRPPKLNGNPVQYQEQSQQEDVGQQHGRGRGRGQGRPPKLHYFRGRGRGRPPKLNQNTSEEQLQPQDQAQGLMNSPCSGRNDNQSLHVQKQGRHHKSESGEPRLGSESRCGSGEVSQSNAGANRANWVLKPLPNRLTQKKNEVIGNFNRKHVNVRTGFQN